MKLRVLTTVLIVVALSVLASHSTAFQEAQGPVEPKSVKPNPDDVPAARVVADPYPAYNGIAVDPQNGLLAASDPNRKTVLVYQPTGAKTENGITIPASQFMGPATNIGMVAGIALDSQHHEIFTANNDIEDTVIALPYGQHGNVTPARILSVPHQAWGLALGPQHDQLAVTVQLYNAIVFYKRDAQGVTPPLRFIRGPNTGMADPHGVFWDEQHNEVGVANHGNFRGLMKNTGAGCEPATPTDTDTEEAGQYLPPSISIYSADAHDDARPLRVIQGDKTTLDWPMGVAADPAHDEIAVANNGDSSLLVFSRSQNGNVAPVRAIRGDRTRINHPMGVAFDSKTGELWVSNYGDHSILAFDRNASGNVAPRRVVRSAPPGTPVPGFGNPEGIAYDTKREQILVPN
jgi:DNA-binding beta-propeller fold protein YncE